MLKFQKWLFIGNSYLAMMLVQKMIGDTLVTSIVCLCIFAITVIIVNKMDNKHSEVEKFSDEIPSTLQLRINSYPYVMASKLKKQSSSLS